ncbi:MAG: DUF3006 domain-containing protein [Firmicutes bacterium]|nr:DUF3006 domain-containing protein [Bacillota bacterium]
MRVIIDRFEGEYAVVELEDGSMAYLAAKLLPGAREGDVVLITVDHEATARRKKRIQGLWQRVAQGKNEKK